MVDYVNDYKNNLTETGKSENTIYAYVTDVNMYLKYLKKKGLNLFDKDNAIVLKYINNLLGNGKSERSINRIIISLRSFYNFLKDNKVINDIPKIEHKSSKEERKLPEVLTVEEVDRIIRIVEKDCPKGVRDNALLELMYATGMKVSELIALKVEDVNLDLNYVRCVDNRNIERIIPIGRSARKALIDYLAIRYKIAEFGVHNLFVNLNGYKLTRQGIWRIVKEYSKKAHINKDVNLNTFRHSFAVHLLQNGANVRAVQKLLGNQVLTYMDTYYEIINNDKINYIYMHTHPRA
ncbi:tyrosine-type recombinase/integrase [Clostridium sp. BJN0001]|uniref:tyrosine-type recombinase/integrase n=1 Tax=Clostridium sp. BJN0001 TaxID=2930219 RepID=UPI001FD110F0|nr:tyrosine-type recombinase/integrase [Clostridium sp. BJN0001]